MKTIDKLLWMTLLVFTLLAMDIWMRNDVVTVSIVYNNTNTFVIHTFKILAILLIVVLFLHIISWFLSLFGLIFRRIKGDKESSILQTISYLILASDEDIPYMKLNIKFVDDALYVKNCKNINKLPLTNNPCIDVFIIKYRIHEFAKESEYELAYNELRYALDNCKDYIQNLENEIIEIMKHYCIMHENSPSNIEKYKSHFSHNYIDKYYSDVLSSFLHNRNMTQDEIEQYLLSYAYKSVSASYLFLEKVGENYDRQKIINVIKYSGKSGITRKIAKYLIKFKLSTDETWEIIGSYPDCNIEKQFIELELNLYNKKYDDAKSNIINIIENPKSDLNDITNILTRPGNQILLNDKDIIQKLQDKYGN